MRIMLAAPVGISALVHRLAALALAPMSERVLMPAEVTRSVVVEMCVRVVLAQPAAPTRVLARRVQAVRFAVGAVVAVATRRVRAVVTRRL
jgi:hypothetical protein